MLTIQRGDRPFPRAEFPSIPSPAGSFSNLDAIPDSSIPEIQVHRPPRTRNVQLLQAFMHRRQVSHSLQATNPRYETCTLRIKPSFIVSSPSVAAELEGQYAMRMPFARPSSSGASTQVLRGNRVESLLAPAHGEDVRNSYQYHKSVQPNVCVDPAGFLS